MIPTQNIHGFAEVNVSHIIPELASLIVTSRDYVVSKMRLTRPITISLVEIEEERANQNERRSPDIRGKQERMS